MGQQLPQLNTPPLHLLPAHQFESRFLQRVRDTPFIDAELYSSDPLVFIDPPGPSLAQLVRPRLGTKQLFPLEEIEKMMGSVLGALVELEENGLDGHGDISLESIYYSKREKGFRVAHPVFSEESGYLLAKHGKRFSALAPEQLSALSDDSEASEVSAKADLFALGIALC
jgi:hypothetical protein